MERKAIINGKVYNTETANHVCSWDNGKYKNDFYRMDFDLYQTKKGQYFVVGDVDSDMEIKFHNGIGLLTPKEASRLAEQANVDEKTYELYFGKPEEG